MLVALDVFPGLLEVLFHAALRVLGLDRLVKFLAFALRDTGLFHPLFLGLLQLFLRLGLLLGRELYGAESAGCQQEKQQQQSRYGKTFQDAHGQR